MNKIVSIMTKFVRNFVSVTRGVTNKFYYRYVGNLPPPPFPSTEPVSANQRLDTLSSSLGLLAARERDSQETLTSLSAGSL